MQGAVLKAANSPRNSNPPPAAKPPPAADRPPAADTSARVRREVWYEGRVQGVGFRYTTRRIADRFQVTGFVKNLPDGRVWLVAEGAADEIERFLGAVQVELGRTIAATRRRGGAASDEFSDFGISL